MSKQLYIFILGSLILIFQASCSPSQSAIQEAIKQTEAAEAFLANALATAIAETQSVLPTDTPMPTDTPTPTARPPEVIFSPSNPGEFSNEYAEENVAVGNESRSAVDAFTVSGDIYIKLKIEELSFTHDWESNGIIIDNLNQEGEEYGENAYVYQANKWNLFEKPPSYTDLWLSWTKNNLSPDEDFTIIIPKGWETLVINYSYGSKVIRLIEPYFDAGDRINIRIQCGPVSSFIISDLTISQE